MGRFSVIGQGSSWQIVDDMGEVQPGTDYGNRLSAEDACRCMNDAEEASMEIAGEISI